MKIANVTERTETAGLAQLARIKGLATRGDIGSIDRLADRYGSARVARVAKAAVPAMSTSNSEALVDAQVITSAFLAMLRNRSIFYTLLETGLVRVPFRTRIGMVTMGANGWIVGEGKPTPLAAISLDNTSIDPIKAGALLAVTEELLTATQSEAVLSRELRRSIVATVDARFMEEVVDSETPRIQSSGIDAEGVVMDLRALIEAVQPTTESRLTLAMNPAVLRGAATMQNLAGGSMFPNLGVFGGEIWSIPTMPSDALAAGEVALFDASQIAGASDPIEIDASGHADVEMLDADLVQDGSAGTGATLVSAWQNDLILIRAIATFGVRRLRENAVAVLEGVAWGGPVPVS